MTATWIKTKDGDVLVCDHCRQISEHCVCADRARFRPETEQEALRRLQDLRRAEFEKDDRNPDAELYFIHDPKTGEWDRVLKSEFARAEGLAVCGTRDEIKVRAAEAMGVPAECVDVAGWQRKIFYLLSSPEHLEAFLELAKKHPKNRIATLSRSTTLYALKKALPGRTVQRVGDRVIIDGEWTLSYHDGLRHDPGTCAHLIEMAKRSEERKLQKVPRGRIRMGVLWPMLRELQSRLRKTPELAAAYDPPVSSRSSTLIFFPLDFPYVRRHAVKAIPVAASLLTRLLGKPTYRTRAWKKSLRILVSKHLDDVLMTPKFKKFILKEAKECRIRM